LPIIKGDKQQKFGKNQNDRVKINKKIIINFLNTPFLSGMPFIIKIKTNVYFCERRFKDKEMKINGIRFETGIFTNCTQDHLDFFKNMREYSECKKLLFKEGRCRRAVINSDDALGVVLLSEVKGAMSYGLPRFRR